MKRYSCENLDEKLKLRVFVGSTLLAVNLLVFILSCIIYIPRIMSHSFIGSGVVSLFLCIAVGLVGGLFLAQYIEDLKLKENKFETIEGLILYASKDISIIEQEDGENVLLVTPKSIHKSMNLYEGKKVRAVRTKKSHLVREVEILNK